MDTSQYCPKTSIAIQIAYKKNQENMACKKNVFDYAMILMRHAWSVPIFFRTVCSNVVSPRNRAADFYRARNNSPTKGAMNHQKKYLAGANKDSMDAENE